MHKIYKMLLLFDQYVLYTILWIDFNTQFCNSSGLGKLEREQCPLPQHIRRLAALLSLVECREIAILLGFQVEEWNDLEYQFQHQPPNDLKFMALWSCIIKKKSFSFGGLISLLEKKGRAAHLLCQVNIMSAFTVITLHWNT